MSDSRSTPGTSVAGFPDGARGITAPLNPGRRGSFLSDVILELGLADRETVDQAVRQSRQAVQNVGRILLAAGTIDEDQLSRAVAERHGLDHVDLEEFDVDLAAASLISPSAAARYDAVPIAFGPDGGLIVALEDPGNALVINDLEVMTKSEIRIAVATGTAIRAVIERLQGLVVPRAQLGSDEEREPAEPQAPEPDQPDAPIGTEDEVVQLRDKLAKADAERERLRKELQAAVEERDRLRAQPATSGPGGAAAELESLREDVSRAERLARDALAAAEEAKQATDELAELRRVLLDAEGAHRA